MGCSTSISSDPVKPITEEKREITLVDFTITEYEYYTYLRNVATVIFNLIETYGKTIFPYITDRRASDIDPSSDKMKSGTFISCQMKYRIPTVLWTPWGKWEFATIDENTSNYLIEGAKIMEELKSIINLELRSNYQNVYIITDSKDIPESSDPARILNIWRTMKQKYDSSPVSTATTINSEHGKTGERKIIHRKSSACSRAVVKSVSRSQQEQQSDVEGEKDKKEEEESQNSTELNVPEKGRGEFKPYTDPHVKDNPLGSPLNIGKTGTVDQPLTL